MQPSAVIVEVRVRRCLIVDVLVVHDRRVLQFLIGGADLPEGVVLLVVCNRIVRFAVLNEPVCHAQIGHGVKVMRVALPPLRLRGHGRDQNRNGDNQRNSQIPKWHLAFLVVWREKRKFPERAREHQTTKGSRKTPYRAKPRRCFGIPSQQWCGGFFMHGGLPTGPWGPPRPPPPTTGCGGQTWSEPHDGPLASASWNGSDTDRRTSAKRNVMFVEGIELSATCGLEASHN